MNKFQSVLKYKKWIYLACIVLGLFIVLLFKGFSNDLNKDFERLFYESLPKKDLDTNIVLINIDSNDLQKLGGWPLKRSYYALLINKLTALKVKAIGLEVMLSNRAALQSIYNDLLNDELKKAGNVVLASVVVGGQKSGNNFARDSIIYSEPKYSNPKLKTGHLDYFSEDGVYIPSKIPIGNSYERSFSSMLARFENKTEDKIIEVNFYNTWQSFKKYNLITFFSMVDNDDPELADLKNKIVIAGVSDPTIAKSIRTNFDDELPGLALHAFALDNILTNRSINYKAKFLVLIISLLLLIVLTQMNIRKNIFKVYLIVGISYLIISFLLLQVFYVQFNYSAFFLPLLFLVMFDSVLYVLQNKIYLRETLTESEILRLSLKRKEDHLKKLQEELNLAEDSKPNELITKINQLKEEVANLQKDQLNDEPVEDIDQGVVRGFHGMVYVSKEMDEVTKLISKVAASDATVLILGESGSGKELAARAIHVLSNRNKNNFVAVNCAALTDSLLESELFGHVKGAFTNAIADKKGKFEAADNGTIFLDEIGETSENFQVKLLRVIQFGELEKVGSTKFEKVNVRIIAATNKNLEQLVKEKKFREDLYYRLNVIQIAMPTLRERKEDIEVLANHFIQSENGNIKLSRAAMDSLKSNDWKGNVRELESVLKRAVILAQAENRSIIKLLDLPEEIVKIDRASVETLILESLREKHFSRSSINETATELGNLNRTVIAENLRGMFFKIYFENDFDFQLAIRNLADSEDEGVIERISSKAETYLKNIKKDLEGFEQKSFGEIKLMFISKYKNLPSRFHFYLDEIVKHLISESPEKT